MQPAYYEDLLEIQNMDAQHNFWNRVNEITSQLNNLGFNADLFHLNKKPTLFEYH